MGVEAAKTDDSELSNEESAAAREVDAARSILDISRVPKLGWDLWWLGWGEVDWDEGRKVGNSSVLAAHPPQP